MQLAVAPTVASFKKTLKTFLFQKTFLWFYVLFNLVFRRFYAVFYDLSSLGNYYSFSVDTIVLTLFGRFLHFTHVYFMRSQYFFFEIFLFSSADENSNIDISTI